MRHQEVDHCRAVDAPMTKVLECLPRRGAIAVRVGADRRVRGEREKLAGIVAG
jgi:hypothetical protein